MQYFINTSIASTVTPEKQEGPGVLKGHFPLPTSEKMHLCPQSLSYKILNRIFALCNCYSQQNSLRYVGQIFPQTT